MVWLAGLGVAAGMVASCGDRFSLNRVAPRAELVAAMGRVRSTEGRLSGGFPFVAYPGATAPRSLSNPAIRRAAQRIQEAAERQGSPQSLADLGILELLHGRTAKAVVLLEKAATADPRDARHWSDLAAAYLARAGNGARPHDLVRALSAADRGVRSDSSLPEARFNRALALDKLFLITDARQAWQDVVRQERDPSWTREAKTHLRRLDEPPETEIWKKERSRLDGAALRGDAATVQAIVGRFRQPARQYAEDELLADWAEKAAAGRAAEAERSLRITRGIGSALVKLGGDAMTHDAVATIDAARAEPGGERLRLLVEAHYAYGIGLQQLKSHQVERATRNLAQAEREFRRAGTPFVLWARLNRAICDYFKPEYGLARFALERLRRELPDGRYPGLLGRILWVLASIDLLRGRPGEVLPVIQEAQRLFKSMDEVENQMPTHELFALSLGAMGKPDEALAHLLAGLRLRNRAHHPARVFALLDEAGMVCLRQGETEVARYFQNELLSHSLTGRNPENIAFARMRRARTLYLTGQRVEALKDLDAATLETWKVPDQGIRSRRQAEISIVRGEVQLAGEPQAAVRSLSDAIAFFERGGLGYYLSMSFFLRARAYLDLGDERRADADFRAGLQEIERTRESTPEESLRIALYDQATMLFDEILTFHASRPGGADRAFEVSERVRARQLFDRSGPHGPILTARQIQRQIPEGTVLVKYALLPDQLLVWTLSRKDATFHQSAVDADALAARVERVRGALQRGGTPLVVGTDLRNLFHALITPVTDAIRGARTLVVVPDKILHLLPFAALVDPQTGRYLVQDHAVSIAPNANIFVRCLLRAHELGGGPPATALVVAAVEFDRQSFPHLPALRAAEAEARLVAAEYPRSQLLVGREATRTRFLGLASGGPQVIHFAGHSVVNPEFPEFSMLLLAGNGGNGSSGAVYSHEVHGMKLGATRLVVLAACSTAAGRISASEGATSLARPFLSAGVPAVLASLWDIDDPAAAHLLTRFHRRLRAGDDPAAALRTVQLSLLGEASLGEWAAFQLIGGVPPSTGEE